MNTIINFQEGSAQALSEHSIFPDVLVPSAEKGPSGHLVVEYPGESSAVTLGNVLPVEAAQTVPNVMLITTEPGKVKEGELFTLAMTDPDAPSRSDHKWSEYCHFLETNVTLGSDDGVSHVVLKGNPQVEHMGPAPPAGTGAHRYVWLLFRQPGRLELSEEELARLQSRINWGYSEKRPPVGVGEFAGEKNLELVAVNFFYAENK
ncbi:AaceriAFR694Wp [[Ashbya] aceris (nom. inval.)]|nr:AaceriAFR694Wp [[Ashbya] aceris (nom. inval.)]